MSEDNNPQKFKKMGPNNPNNFKIRGYALTIYETMIKDAIVDTEDNLIKWSGSMAELFRNSGINQGYHTPVTRLLKATNCMEQTVRGSRGIASVWVLYRDPRTIPEAEWPSVTSIVKSPKSHLTTSAAEYRLLVQEVRGLRESLGGLNVVTALSDLQQQLTAITVRLDKLEQS